MQSKSLIGQASQDDWHKDLLESLASVKDLANYGLISKEQETTLSTLELQGKYKVRVTKYYADLISKIDLDCPIRSQAIPDPEECRDPILPRSIESWSQLIYGRPTPWDRDSIGDLRHQKAARITHRYENRAILHITSMCSVYCRFCFRKEHLNDELKPLYQSGFSDALSYIAQHTEIREIILTGGDPLSMTDAWLEGFISRLETHEHLRVLRIHTRTPVTLPNRITENLCRVLRKSRLQIFIVSHFNHPKELTSQSRSALAALRTSGFSVLNQSVLLKGINNNSQVLADLFNDLSEIGVLPMYLHHPDWTPGTFHFRVSVDEGKQIYRSLIGKLSGPALPKYVLDSPLGTGKVPVCDSHYLKETSHFKDSGFGCKVYSLSDGAPVFLDIWKV
jgi:lysine 2,3-aminomutase